jgi:SAM-dependent methyltransferase
MHEESKHFLRFVASSFKKNFTMDKLVLDVGSYDFNGTNRDLFDKSCTYYGNDVAPAESVNLPFVTSELPFFEPTFDTIVSSECFQNDPEYVKSLKKIVEILRPGGLFAFTCATTGCPEFGTRRFYPTRSLATLEDWPKWNTYFKPLTFEDLKAAIPLNDVFSNYAAYYNANSKDFMFVGIKKRAVAAKVVIPDYRAPHVEKVISYPEGGEFSIPVTHPKIQPAISQKEIVAKIQPIPEKTQPTTKEIHPAISQKEIIAKIQPVQTPTQSLSSITNPLPEIQPVPPIKDSLNIIAPKITKKEMESIFNKIAEETFIAPVHEKTQEEIILESLPESHLENHVENHVETLVESHVENHVENHVETLVEPLVENYVETHEENHEEILVDYLPETHEQDFVELPTEEKIEKSE